MEKSSSFVYCGIGSEAFSSPRAALRHAKESVYHWWWASAQLSPAFWYARETGKVPVERAVAVTYDLMQDHLLDSFTRWWLRTGSDLFVDPIPPTFVELSSGRETNRRVKAELSVLVEIPLTIHQRDIHRQLRDLLRKIHLGRKLQLADYSEAALKPLARRCRVHALENQYWAWLYRLIYPTITTAQIGDRLQFAPQHKIRGVHTENTAIRYYSLKNPYAGPHHHLMSITGRYLYKARFAQWHIDRGVFPCYSSPSEAFPFGKRAHADYIEATDLAAKKSSAYRDWVRQKFSRRLRNEVIRRNHLRDEMNNSDSPLVKNFDAFLAGKTDRFG